MLNGTYQPLSRPIFIYVNAKSAREARGQGVRRVLHEERRQAGQGSEVRAACRPRPTSTTCEHLAKKRKTGTAFGGENEVGVKHRRPAEARSQAVILAAMPARGRAACLAAAFRCRRPSAA
ncbi:MAG: hypothetical protein MZW92_79240 [Comamonadaceae bacterium]|nr:hypothetical protein [Comamonadaceae bacterium]